MKYIPLLIVLVLAQYFIPGCSAAGNRDYKRYSGSIFDTFDTLIQVIIYAESEEQFYAYYDHLHTRLKELHELYDIYNDYKGVNNIKTINDQAGVRPVEVRDEVIDLILFAKEWGKKTDGRVNIALGPVLKIWHRYRQEALYDPAKAVLPSEEELFEAGRYTDLERIIVDLEKNTVYLPDKRMSLDVGALAKGYALEIAASELIAGGVDSAILSAGGSIRTIGLPKNNEREYWSIGIRDPDAALMVGTDGILDLVYIKEGSVDTSGDYQRYYRVEGETIHHIINPETFMPAKYYRSVTVLAERAHVADFASTTLFLLPYDESLALAEKLENIEALWVMPGGEVRATGGMEEKLRSYKTNNYTN